MNAISSLNLASIQMVSASDWITNKKNAHTLIAQAADAGARVIALPEYFCLMGHSDSDKVALREQFNSGPIQDSLRQWASHHGIYLVAGTIPLYSKDPQKVRNTTLVYDPSGNVIARYDKIHLFGFKQGTEEYQESKTIESGSQPVTFTIDHEGTTWRFGLSICYDIRFPELYRAMGAIDCHIVPAAFTYTTGKAHWEILLRARAIENQSYLLASAQGGQHENGRSTWGHSMFIDPWGNIISQLEQNSGYLIGTINKNTIAEIRGKLPALKHRTLT